jgi:hypothetical protein
LTAKSTNKVVPSRDTSRLYPTEARHGSSASASEEERIDTHAKYLGKERRVSAVLS